MIYFITAIGTESGKTITSAVFAQALGADYWKPIQAGLPRDSDIIKKLVRKPIKVFPEKYLLKTPASPHAAAKIDNVQIDLNCIHLPNYDKSLIVEGAGGLMVPLNDDEFIADLIVKLKIPVILVINLYLGCINHSLLTSEVLKQRKITIAGIVFNGAPNPESERIILKHLGRPCWLRINQEPEINPSMINKYAEILNRNVRNEGNN